MSSLRSWAPHRTRLQIGLWRHGWIGLVAVGLLCTVLGMQWLFVRPLERQQAEVELQLGRERAATVQRFEVDSATEAKVDQHAWQALQAVLVDEARVPTVLNEVLGLAKASALKIQQSEFQTSRQGYAGLHRVQVTWPVRGRYSALREFVERVLRQQPGVSLDEWSLARAAVEQGEVETRMRFSIWVRPAAALGSAPAAPVKDATP